MAGCGGTQSLDIHAKPIDRPELNLPRPDAMSLDLVDWRVISKTVPANAPGSIGSVWNETKVDSLFALTPSDYDAMHLNLNKMLAYIKQQNALIESFRKYYAPQETLQTPPKK